jgi:hypothetical protein
MPAPAFSYAPPSGASPVTGLLKKPLAPPSGQLPQTQSKLLGLLPAASGNTGAMGGGQTWAGGGKNTKQSGTPQGYQGYDPGHPAGHDKLGPYAAQPGHSYQPGENGGGGDNPYGGRAPGGGGGRAGGQQTLQSGAFYEPDAGSSSAPTYQAAGVADDPNAKNIYGVINSELNQRANQSAPQLGSASMYGGAQISPTMMTSGAQLDTGSDLQYQGAQNAQINQLAAIASGQGPSVAATTAAQQRDANVAASMAMLGSQRGSSSTASGLLASQNAAAGADNAAAQQAALGRAQEAMAAQQQLTGALGGARGQTQATSQYQAGLQQQADLANQSAYNQQAQAQANLYQQAGLANAGAQNQFDLANQQAQLSQTGMNNQAYNAGLASYMGQNQQDITNAMTEQQQIANEELQRYGIDNNVAIQQQQMAAQAGASGVAALGALAMMSDERAKEEIRPGAGEVRSFLDGLKPHSYEYKNKRFGAGRYLSPMAQEIEKHPLGKSAIYETPAGKMVDYNRIGGGPGRLPGVLIAADAMLNRRIDELERRLARKGRR